MAALYIPEDVLEGILSRLPVESIIRFKCVCKSWYSLFQNPNFAAKHLSNQSVDDHIFIQRCVEGKYDNYYLSRDINIDDNNYAPHFVVVKAELPFINDGLGFSLIGHCDGLIAFFDHFDFRICNPATRELTTLPRSSFHPINPPTDHAYPRTFADLAAMGFGYDSNTNDYKVVRVFRYYDSHAISDTLDYTAEVFSLRNDSSWRPIKYSLDSTIWFCGRVYHQCFCNGIYYWLASKGDDWYSGKALLISFHMGDEEFQTVSLHDDCLDIFDDDVDLYTILDVYKNDFIALYTIYPHQAWMDVWVMKEFGVKESWTKVLTIEPIPVIETSLDTFWNNDKVLLSVDEEGNLCCFDLVTKEFNCHGLGILYAESCFWSAVPYMKTIVSVNTQRRRRVL